MRGGNQGLSKFPLFAGFIQVRENWKSQGKLENAFQSLESQGIQIIHRLSGKVGEFENSWVENKTSVRNQLFFEAEKTQYK